MVFIDNKYTKWYYKIISTAKSRTLVTYTEKHHIIPKSLGGSNLKDNIVALTAREHYICHLLLVRMTTGLYKHKMIHAAFSFIKWASIRHDRTIKFNSRIYSSIKKQKSELMKQRYRTDVEYALKTKTVLANLWKNPTHAESMSKTRKELWKNEEYRSKMKNRKPTFKKLSINGVVYESCIEASKYYGLTANCVAKRCLNKSKKFADWFYI